MSIDRREFMGLASAASGASFVANHAAAQLGLSTNLPRVAPAAYKRIAAEEAWGPIEVFRQWKRLLDSNPADEPGFVALWRKLDPAGNTGFTPRLTDLGPARIAAMDAAGIDMQILMLTAPGVQVFDAATGTRLASESNNELAAACRNHPDRYAGLAAVRRSAFTHVRRRPVWWGRSSNTTCIAATSDSASSLRFIRRPSCMPASSIDFRI
jgi:2,3-dihydroxybenzoate decarboxylase